MLKAFLVRLSPLVIMYVANLLLWLLLRGEFNAGTERGQIYEYFVMYVLYFTLLISCFCIGASLVRPRAGGNASAKAAYFALSIPPAAFSLIAGLLSLSVAFNSMFFAILPAALYFVALFLIVRPEFVFTRFFVSR